MGGIVRWILDRLPTSVQKQIVMWVLDLSLDNPVWEFPPKEETK